MAFSVLDSVQVEFDAGDASAQSSGIDSRRSSLMIKPVGATCNLRCSYCYYLPVAEDYDQPARRMSLVTLESTLAGYLPGAPDTVTISWQGGEPTLAGLSWFEKMIELVEKHRRPTQQVSHCLQTNGTLLNDKWAAFFKQHQFLLGVSLDGLLADHDYYRIDPSKPDQPGTYTRVLQGIATLRKHAVEFNVLVVLNDRNVHHPARMWKQLMALQFDWLQFIPAIEWVQQPTDDGRWETAAFSPSGEDYGKFLCEVFDLWFAKHRHRVSVRMFDAILGLLIDGRATECTYAKTCATQVTLEQDGSVYGCDHYVQTEWKLGRVGAETSCSSVPLTVAGRDPSSANTFNQKDTLDTGWMRRLDGERFATFGRRKADLDPRCFSCDYRSLCNGGCPKHRPARGELPGPSVLCPGYQRFFTHALPRLEWLTDHLRRGVTPPMGVPNHLMPSKPLRRPRGRKRRR
jgi:uncharacterized protein